MTLCVAWRRNGTVHFASDSRLTLGTNSYADVGIKVISLPYVILHPATEGAADRQVAFTGELGMCFAGSAINSLVLKECVVEILKTLQHAPGYTDTSMAGIASFIFSAYKIISKEVCATVLGSNGRANILVGGLCSQQKKIRVFQFSTDDQNNHRMAEVLTDSDHVFVGTGAAAEEDIPKYPNDMDYINVLKSVIKDPTVPTVGGHLQYGCFRAERFIVYGVIDLDDGVHYWRGAVDLNSTEFMSGPHSLVPGIPFVDPYATIRS